jgi:hypothetical protein
MLIRHQARLMTKNLIDRVGFSHPVDRTRAQARRTRAFAELITTTALAVSLAIAVIAVSIECARADTRGGMIAYGSVR